MSSDVIVQVQDLSKYYQLADRKIDILKNISFEIKKGAMIALLGPSGSGKTTLLNILGLIDQMSSGHVRIGEYDLNHAKLDRNSIRRSFVGYIFQQFHLLPQFNAITNVCLPLVPVKTKFNVEERAKTLLQQVGLGHRINHLPSEMSGGEQQRVAIARALISSPQILLCDEPTGNLDSANRDAILHLLSELNREGLTIIIATHDEEVANRCDYRLEIKDGHLLEKVKEM